MGNFLAHTSFRFRVIPAYAGIQGSRPVFWIYRNGVKNLSVRPLFPWIPVFTGMTQEKRGGRAID